MQNAIASETTTAAWNGEALRQTLWFLAIPAVVGVAILVFGVKLPWWALYGVAGLIGLRMVMQTFRDPEWLLACFIIYIPLNKMFVIPIAPGINGTNLFEMLLLWAWAMHASSRDKEKNPLPTAFSTLIKCYAGWSLLSIITASVYFGFGNILSSHALDIKGWLDQFLIFFAVLHLIRDGQMARRLIFYLVLGTLVVIGLGIDEWLDKRFLSSIEKARLMGPQLQPNDFGAFLAYNGIMLLAWFIVAVGRLRTWFVLPPLLIMLGKLLLATFSRGGYLAFGFAGVAMGYVRGKLFLFSTAIMFVILIIAMPDLVPESLKERMSQTTADSGATQALDKSSQTRIILWHAAIDMSLESPVFGKGFKSFPKLKSQYAEEETEESDNHNMYLYLASQMGIPAVILFLLLLFRMYLVGTRIFEHFSDPYNRFVGLSAVGMMAAIAMTNMFGSRMVDISVSCYVWVMLAALAHIYAEIPIKKKSRFKNANG